MGPSRCRTSGTGELINKSLQILTHHFRATTKGYKPDAIDRCLEEYESLDVWQLNQARTRLTILNNL